MAAVGDDIKRRGEHADNAGDNAIGEYESGDGSGAPSGEYQSATRFGVSANPPGENRSRAAIRPGVNANCAGERADTAGVSSDLLDVNFNLADDNNGVTGEGGGEPLARAIAKRTLKSFSGAIDEEINGLDIDLCTEQSHTGGCAVVNGATEAETGE